MFLASHRRSSDIQLENVALAEQENNRGFPCDGAALGLVRRYFTVTPYGSAPNMGPLIIKNGVPSRRKIAKAGAIEVQVSNN
jgi:hypothetical protein